MTNETCRQEMRITLKYQQTTEKAWRPGLVRSYLGTFLSAERSSLLSIGWIYGHRTVPPEHFALISDELYQCAPANTALLYNTGLRVEEVCNITVIFGLTVPAQRYVILI